MTASGAANLQTYETQQVADHYAQLDYLTPCERLLFETYIPAGSAILDLGVGGGRTSGYLACRGRRYVGVDYAAAMVEVCRRKYPKLEFMIADASDLSVFRENSFDAVVFAFNGLDYVLPESRRRSCLDHISRILKPGGCLIFSSHNPRAILVRRGWNRNRISQIAQRWSFGSAVLRWIVWTVLASARKILAFFQAMTATTARVVTRVPSRMFWQGEGTQTDSAHGGLSTHYSTARHVLTELSDFEFHPVRILGDDYPRASHILATDWYYYVFIKSCKK